MDAYSTDGPTKALYACAFNCWLFVCEFHLWNPRVLQVLLVILLMCVSHVNLLLKVTARYFALDTCSNLCPGKVYNYII